MEEERDEEKSSAAEFTLKEEANKADTQVCEVCGSCFETRRGLSSHARSHLRQMGVCVSESSGAPITLLYHLITERDGKLPFSPELSNTPNDTHPPKTLTKNKPSPGFDSKPCFRESLSKADLGAKLKIKIGELVKRHSIGSSSSKKSSFTSTSESPVKPCTSPTNSSPQMQTAVPPSVPDSVLGKPASQVNLTEVMVASSCEMCGVWYETRKGLASHSRAHLRQLGVSLDYKVSPIQVLHELLEKKKEKLGQAGEESLQAPPTGSLTPPPAKKKKSSITIEKTPGTVLKEVNCEFCGENFKNNQCLASHSRSHLRQLGITNWEGTPIGMLREVMACQGRTSLPKPTKNAPTTALATKPRKVLSPSSSSSPAKVPASLPDALPAAPRAAQAAALCTKQTADLSDSVPSSVLPPPVPGVNPGRVPKAKKGTRTVVPKPKGEASHLNIPATEPTNATSAASESIHRSDLSLTSTNPISASVIGLQEEVGMVEPVRCSYCNDIFESRKALSCHARAHLRQLGVQWAQYSSPISMLHELMIREGRGHGSEDTAKGKLFTPSHIDFTSREKTDCMDPGTTVCEATCELCGFDFENRKALASHARAHLRQLGEQWSPNQSPIEVLSMWMSREPEKVQQLHQLYQQGVFPHIRKRRSRSSRGFSFHGDSACSSVIRPSSSGRENKSGLPLSSHRKLSFHRPAVNTAGGSTHFFQGCKPHHSKLLPHNLERTEALKRVRNPPSLVPPPPETSLVKLVGKIYSLKCRFCEQVFHGPLSIQEDWLIHLRHHILNPSPAPPQTSVDTAQLIGQAV